MRWIIEKLIIFCKNRADKYLVGQKSFDTVNIENGIKLIKWLKRIKWLQKQAATRQIK